MLGGETKQVRGLRWVGASVGMMFVQRAELNEGENSVGTRRGVLQAAGAARAKALRQGRAEGHVDRERSEQGAVSQGKNVTPQVMGHHRRA